LAQDSVTLGSRLPGSIDAIVGIARSGLIPGGIVASMMHRPLWLAGRSQSPDSIVQCDAGWRIASDKAPDSFPAPKSVVVVDDSTGSAQSIGAAAAAVRAKWPEAKVYTAVIYATPAAASKVDYVVFKYSPPHYYEWNLFNGIHADAAYAAVATDLDGVLCPEVPLGCDDDGAKYLDTITSAPILQRPNRRPITLIITARLEKYREVTEEWLRHAGIHWDRLVMGPWVSLKERNSIGAQGVGRWKASVYGESHCRLMVESDAIQAGVIRRITGKEVLCPAAATVAGSPAPRPKPVHPVRRKPPTLPRPEITRTNLIYHVYPTLADDAGWRQCIAELREHWGAFSGRKILSVASGPGCAPLSDVQAALGKPDAEWALVKNDARLCEHASFLNLLTAIGNTNSNEATFYGHTKGVATKVHREGAELWRRGLVRTLLGQHQAATAKLREYAAVGGCKMLRPPMVRKRFPSGLAWPEWMFAGTLFWFRHDAVYSHPRWNKVPSDRYASEAWIGGLVPCDQATSFYQPWPENGSGEVWPYDPKWHQPESPLFVQGLESKNEILSRYTSHRWNRVMELGPWNGLDSVWIAPWCDELVSIEGKSANIDVAENRCKRAGVENVRFVEGNLESFDLVSIGRFDCVWAAGILYHMPKPWELMQRIAAVTDTCFGWSHVASKASLERGGYHGQTYHELVGTELAGVSPESFWMTSDEFVRAWKDVGFDCRWLTTPAPSPNGGLVRQFEAMRIPKVSIIIPTLGRDSLAAALNSVLPQLLPNDEVIVVGDRWTPNGLPSRVKSLRIDSERNYDGGSTGRNRALSEATGDVICYLDDDDQYAPNALATIRRTVEAAPRALHLFRMRQSDGLVTWREKKIEYGNIGTPCIVHRRLPRPILWDLDEGQDYRFAESLAALMPVVWHDEIVCLVGRAHEAQ